jgi:SAM-dependent methyltransferase
MLQTARLELLRCVSQTDEGDRCLGVLDDDDDGLYCQTCGTRYPVVRGVPVLKPEHTEATETWFEAMYEHRSRYVDLASDYLRAEREFLERFAKERALTGPCLEVGSGTGCFADIVPDYVGLDYALNSLLAEGFESAARICGDARRLPFSDQSMECVFSFNTLEHVPDVQMAFSEIDRVVKPGGYVVMKPAWHCVKYVTELIPVRPYSELNPRQRLVKALLPVIRSRPYKFLTWMPSRILRRLTSGANNPLRWGRLIPYHGDAWISDADAVASIDCHEGILYYTSRGYSCHSHPTAIRQLLAGHDLVVLQKNAATL